jgi:hypothetical protein
LVLFLFWYSALRQKGEYYGNRKRRAINGREPAKDQDPEKGKKTVKCPTCGMEYRVHWVNPNLPRIRGPVWDVNRKLAEAKLKELGVK